MRSLLRRVFSVPGAVVWVPALVIFLLASIPTWLEGPPAPVIEDEYGYLLSAETFVEGRLTNPTHPLWHQFEALHQIQEPSYQSKYPPAQALFMALGQRIYHPIVGIWISVALMIASIVWMLLAFMPKRWAWIGGWVAVFQYSMIGIPFNGTGGTFGYWSQSYWGGAVAAAGGALVFGAALRLVKTQRPWHAVLLALGLLLMANSRPLEGLVASLLPCGYVAYWLFRQRGPEAKRAWTRVALPALAVLVPGFLAMGTYNQAVTGKATEMPWSTHWNQYCIFPVFIFGEPPEREWRHPDMEAFHDGKERYMHERHATFEGFAQATIGKTSRFLIFYFGPIFGIVLLLASLRLLLDRKAWLLVIPTVLVGVVGLSKFSMPPHYNAPVAALTIGLIVQGLRYLNTWRRAENQLGRMLVRVAVAASFVYFVVGISRCVDNARTTRSYDRVQALEMLETIPGDHLVLVSYGKQEPPFEQWMFNAADIDSARVVWARDSDPEARKQLIDYYPDRKVWTLRSADGDPHPRPVPFEVAR